MAVVKLDSGYNIGVPPDSCRFISRAEPVIVKQQEVLQNTSLPNLAIVSTGGTIASRIDYRTGSVTSQFNANDILTAIPELKEIANYRTVPLATILSENMTPAIWQELARAVYKEIQGGATGVIVTHGTDTMGYSAAALSFMIDTPVPVIFVGSQRSADRPSSDNAMNAVCAAAAATSDLGEVAVVMHATTSDDILCYPPRDPGSQDAHLPPGCVPEHRYRTHRGGGVSLPQSDTHKRCSAAQNPHPCPPR